MNKWTKIYLLEGEFKITDISLINISLILHNVFCFRQNFSARCPIHLNKISVYFFRQFLVAHCFKFGDIVPLLL